MAARSNSDCVLTSICKINCFEHVVVVFNEDDDARIQVLFGEFRACKMLHCKLITSFVPSFCAVIGRYDPYVQRRYITRISKDNNYEDFSMHNTFLNNHSPCFQMKFKRGLLYSFIKPFLWLFSMKTFARDKSR